MSKTRLALAIPTYNRPDVLYDNLKLMIPVLKKNNIPLYISDDSNNCYTEKKINELSNEFCWDGIKYKKNEPALGHDNNCISTLSLPNSEYVWYLGDSILVEPSAIEYVLSVLNKEKNIDLISLNSLSKIKNDPGYINDVSKFLVKNTWYLTMTGTTIYSARVINCALNMTLKSSYRNFMQLAIILYFCSINKVKYYWVDRDSISVNKNKTNSYWARKTVDVFAVDWTNLIRSFGNVLFTEQEVSDVVMSHSVNTSIFSFSNWCRIRSVNGISKELYNKYNNEIHMASKTPSYLIRLILILNPKMLSVLLSVFDKIRR